MKEEYLSNSGPSAFENFFSAISICDDILAKERCMYGKWRRIASVWGQVETQSKSHWFWVDIRSGYLRFLCQIFWDQDSDNNWENAGTLGTNLKLKGQPGGT